MRRKDKLAQARCKSYHPLLAFEGQFRLCLNAVLRSGRRVTVTRKSSGRSSWAALSRSRQGLAVRSHRDQSWVGSDDIWRFFNQRCCMENYIKEAKGRLFHPSNPDASFEANEIDLLLKLMAYTLYERFKLDCCEPIQYGYSISRFRLEFFQVAGVSFTTAGNSL